MFLLMIHTIPLLTTTWYQVASINGEIVTHYGKLEHIITITLSEERCKSLQPPGLANSIFELTHRFILKDDDTQLASLDIYFFSKEKELFDIVDITCV